MRRAIPVLCEKAQQENENKSASSKTQEVK